MGGTASFKFYTSLCVIILETIRKKKTNKLEFLLSLKVRCLQFAVETQEIVE